MYSICMDKRQFVLKETEDVFGVGMASTVVAKGLVLPDGQVVVFWSGLGKIEFYPDLGNLVSSFGDNMDLTWEEEI